MCFYLKYIQRGQELKHPVISSLCTLEWWRSNHYSGPAPTPPPKGRDVSEDTQVEVVF